MSALTHCYSFKGGRFTSDSIAYGQRSYLFTWIRCRQSWLYLVVHEHIVWSQGSVYHAVLVHELKAFQHLVSHLEHHVRAGRRGRTRHSNKSISCWEYAKGPPTSGLRQSLNVTPLCVATVRASQSLSNGTWSQNTSRDTLHYHDNKQGYCVICRWSVYASPIPAPMLPQYYSHLRNN